MVEIGGWSRRRAGAGHYLAVEIMDNGKEGRRWLVPRFNRPEGRFS